MGISSRSWPNSAPVVTSAVREHNLSIVLREIRRSQPTSRSAVAKATGLSPGSLTALVPSLLERGLVKETPSNTSKRGRPTTTLEIDGSKTAFIAVEARFDELLLTSTDFGLRVLHEEDWVVARKETSPETIAKQLAAAAEGEMIRLQKNGYQVASISIIVPTPLIGTPPIVLASTDFGWTESIDILKLIKNQTSIPEHLLSIHSDAWVAASAEYHAIKSENSLTALYLKADTGIGGALVSNGEVFRGGKGIGFTPGHVVVIPGGQKCTCGRHGCLVAEIGPEASIVRGGLQDLAREKGLPFAYKELISQARSNQASAVEVFTKSSQILQKFTLDMSVVFDPDLIIFGGLWADAFDLLNPESDWDMRIPVLLDEMRHQNGAGDFVRRSVLGDRAARIGAIEIALEGVVDSPSSIEG